MNTAQWRITISHPDYCPDPNVFSLDTDQLCHITRNHEFNAMIDASDVPGALIAAVEAIQDKTY
jgi:hypothetical protein